MPVARPDFEERSFEGALNAELARDRGRVFTPGQVEEAILGYDAAAIPGDAARAALARVAGIDVPPAVWLTPNWWLRCAVRPEGSILPSRFASLLLQYKRPSLWYGASAPLIDAHGGPYYRFGFKSSQHRTLLRLDEALQDEVLVRYASPCTHTRKALEQWQIDYAVLENTNFVSPRRIGLRHKGWTYRSPGGVGYRNEFAGDDDALEAEPIAALLGQLRDRPGALALDQHLSLLLRRLGGEGADAAVDEAVLTLDAVDADSAPAVAVLVRLLLVGLEFQAADASWWLLELD